MAPISDQHENTTLPFLTTKKPLDCSGNDSGKNECWSNWLNIGVPILMSVTFVLVLLIMFVCWPKHDIKSANPDLEANGDTKKLADTFKEDNHNGETLEEETTIAQL
ncbi:hypothetical protein HELRODRAFT_168697 [Helobdella robusta]|uniref:Uncharacterized protein n=1 Tax=Helobdella robusta TaxID=6412 RepID=T1F0V4_HELRO|nr:hypothetical protein HELRODRAFT_168697 [Helobdella robusta]ESO08791.1 hypothetical protein HELRODRAFT_168697 [Helobdella robusta]